MPIEAERELAEFARWIEDRTSAPMRPPQPAAASVVERSSPASKPRPARVRLGAVVALFVIAVAVAGLALARRDDAGDRVVAGSSTETVAQALLPIETPPSPSRPEETTASTPVPSSAATTTPVATSRPSTPAPADTVFIPPRQGPLDWRDPVQRFLGAPEDLDEAIKMSEAVRTQAVRECEAERVDPAADCERIASDRVNLFPALEDEWASLDQQALSDPAVVAARDAMTQCFSNAGVDPMTPSSAPGPCEVERTASRTAIAEAVERYAPAWINEHSEALLALRDDIAHLYAAANE